MDIQCSAKELFILEKVANAAEELQLPCYLIGGFVRDKIIGRQTKDADIVCLGDGVRLVLEGNQAGDGAEDLLLRDAHAIVDIGKDRGFDEVPVGQRRRQ